MTLPTDFLFSQQKLEDYLACPKRFELRYIQKRIWPAVQSQPVLELEQLMELGQRFHLMVQQHQCGVPLESINRQASDPLLQQWWQSYLSAGPADLPARRHPEFSLHTNLCGFRTAVQYDLLAIEPGIRAVIIDWKTSQQKPSRTRLQERMQTRLYPLLLVEAGAYLNDAQPVEPDQVEMIYWFPCSPNQPERFRYSESQYLADRALVMDLISRIAAGGDMPATLDEKRCRFCIYRSLCERGSEAGILDSTEEPGENKDFSFNFDFDQIGEVLLS